METLGERLKKCRAAAGLDRQELANRIGVKLTSVTFWETNKARPTFQNLAKLSALFDCSNQWLKTGQESFCEEVFIDSIGYRIKEKRLERDLLQQELADAIGVKRPSISQWETNETKPNGKNLVELSRALGCDIFYLQTGTKPEKESIFEGLSIDALQIIKAISKLDKTDRQKLKAVRILLCL